MVTRPRTRSGCSAASCSAHGAALGEPDDHRSIGAGRVQDVEGVLDLAVAVVGGRVEGAVGRAVAGAVVGDDPVVAGEVGQLQLPEPRVDDRPRRQEQERRPTRAVDRVVDPHALVHEVTLGVRGGGTGHRSLSAPAPLRCTGQFGEPAQDEAVSMVPVEVLPRDGQPHPGEAGDERGERDLRLQPGQPGPEAVVDAVAERQVRAAGAPDVEDVGVLGPRGVAPRRGQRDQHLDPGRHGRAGDRHVAGRVAEGRVGDRRVVPQQLLDGLRHERGVGDEGLPLLTVLEESGDAVADEAGRRVVPGDDELEEGREQLLAGEPSVPAGEDEVADEVLAGYVPPSRRRGR